MADLESALRQRAHANAQAEARARQEQEQITITQLLQDAARLERLAQDRDMKWFLETYIAPIVEAERTAALDIHRPAADRDHAAHRHDLARTILHLLPHKAAETRTKATALTQK